MPFRVFRIAVKAHHQRKRLVGVGTLHDVVTVGACGDLEALGSQL
jgi:hypothetical protein